MQDGIYTGSIKKKSMFEHKINNLNELKRFYGDATFRAIAAAMEKGE